MNNVTPFGKKQHTETVYVSGVRNFLGVYFKVTLGAGGEFADETELRLHLNQHYRQYWCSVYPSVEEIVGDREVLIRDLGWLAERVKELS